jgi:DNA-directed RNA polymerase subunit RPC12/RpoP
MSDHFINLNCAHCGGKLEVYDDMERFVCGYCGSEMIVQRRGGTVALRAITEAIKQVQVGTDKTAAELAIVRYEKELWELRQSLEIAKKGDNSGGTTMGCGAIVILVGVGLGMAIQSGLWGIIVVLIGAALMFFGYKAPNTKRTDAILKRIEFVKRQMNDKKRLVDS